jgi:hypothetical protein
MLIPAVSFWVGSPEGELERAGDEGPQHEVTLPQFFMAKYSVTPAQWRVVAAMPEANQALNPDPSGFKGELHPVGMVSWHDAVEFCNRLSRLGENRRPSRRGDCTDYPLKPNGSMPVEPARLPPSTSVKPSRTDNFALKNHRLDFPMRRHDGKTGMENSCSSLSRLL